MTVAENAARIDQLRTEYRSLKQDLRGIQLRMQEIRLEIERLRRENTVLVDGHEIDLTPALRLRKAHP